MANEYVLQTGPGARTSTIDYRAALNADQFEAVTAAPGPMLVIAGAGSGKTRTLTYRVAYLIEQGVAPWQILLLTFTNKAAREMLSRVGSLLPYDISALWGGTFHAIGHRLLRRHADLLGYERDFTILDEDDAADLVAGALAEAGFDPKDKRVPKPKLAHHIFGLALNRRQPLGQLLEDQYGYFDEIAEGLEKAAAFFTRRKRDANVMDFDDLLTLTLRLLQEHAEPREKYQRQFQHVLVDEYQDTSALQGAMIDALAAEHRQVMVVGDDAQSIYSWRGANFRNILDFPERYAGTRVIRIETNYRSTPEILSLANEAIAANRHQFEKNLRSVRPADSLPKPAVVPLEDGNQQAQFVAQRVMDLHEEGTGLDEIAVLYRSHFHSLEIQMELVRRNIPFEVTSGMRFFEQAHVKDVGAYLKLALNPRDETAFKRLALLLPGIGKVTAGALWAKLALGGKWSDLKPPRKAAGEWAQLGHTLEQLRADDLTGRPSEQIQIVLDAGYEAHLRSKYDNAANRVEDLNQLRAFAEQFDTAADFLGQLALLTNVDSGPQTAAERRPGPHDEDEPKLRLTTVHQAKGLEWKAVFVVMLCDGLFPSSRSMENDDGEEEERRLFYVAVTRAKDELYLTYPMIRAQAGMGDRWQEASRFLAEISDERVNTWKVVPPKPAWHEAEDDYNQETYPDDY
ncbi:MAG: ATP-dependent helicase [Verrucomicrobiota bacterium]